MTSAKMFANLTLMGKLETIEKFVAELPAEDLRIFREWFDEFLAQKFDEQIERDITAGKLDALAEEALADLKAGRTTPL
jgi:hypothetical protein